MNESAEKTKSNLLRQTLIVVAVTVAGFMFVGGWRLIADYSNWHYEIFLHANGVEEYLSLLNWLASGPVWGALVGAIAGIIIVFVSGKSKAESSP